jgi:hypothetical protein
MPEIIGRGEILTGRILNFLYPGCYILTQLPMEWLARKYAPHWLDEGMISEENLKRTLDMFVVSGEFNKNDIKMAVRVQDQKTHSGDHKGVIDRVQKEMLIDWGCTVCDIHERESKDLFANKLNYKSVMAVCRAIEEAEK